MPTRDRGMSNATRSKLERAIGFGGKTPDSHHVNLSEADRVAANNATLARMRAPRGGFTADNPAPGSPAHMAKHGGGIAVMHTSRGAGNVVKPGAGAGKSQQVYREGLHQQTAQRQHDMTIGRVKNDVAPGSAPTSTDRALSGGFSPNMHPRYAKGTGGGLGGKFKKK